MIEYLTRNSIQWTPRVYSNTRTVLFLWQITSFQSVKNMYNLKLITRGGIENGSILYKHVRRNETSFRKIHLIYSGNIILCMYFYLKITLDYSAHFEETFEVVYLSQRHCQENSSLENGPQYDTEIRTLVDWSMNSVPNLQKTVSMDDQNQRTFLYVQQEKFRFNSMKQFMILPVVSHVHEFLPYLKKKESFWLIFFFLQRQQHFFRVPNYQKQNYRVLEALEMRHVPPCTLVHFLLLVGWSSDPWSCYPSLQGCLL